MQILARYNKFVIDIKEWITSTGQHYRRAVSGWIGKKNRIYIQKECTNREIQDGELINISLGFRRYEADPEQIESVDYLFIRDTIIIKYVWSVLDMEVVKCNIVT
jgi:hypothetical protein